MMLEWTPPDGHPIQIEIAEVFGWCFYDIETQNRCREWLFERYPGICGVGFYEDELDETNSIMFFETEEHMAMWLLKYA